MRIGYPISLIVAVTFSGFYFYQFAAAVCPVPLSYSLGVLDERFGLTEAEALSAISSAEKVWEEVLGEELFFYDPGAEFKVNFIYDERQEFVKEEQTWQDKLRAAENINHAILETHADLVDQYESLKANYSTKMQDFEHRFSEYNQKVSEYNDQGGAPPSVYEELEGQKQQLEKEKNILDKNADELNQLVERINQVSEQGNQLIRSYNENVGNFNNRFGDEREFTQGDYQGEFINIYTYQDQVELQTVLAHELGHALSLDHVAGSSSIMYHLIGGQPENLSLSETDRAEFKRICTDMTLWDKIVFRLSNN